MNMPKLPKLKLPPKPKLPPIRDCVHRHSVKIHRIKASMEAMCFAAVAGGVHTVEIFIAGSLAVIIVVLVIVGDEA